MDIEGTNFPEFILLIYFPFHKKITIWINVTTTMSIIIKHLLLYNILVP